jgi:hypothetical protein
MKLLSLLLLSSSMVFADSATNALAGNKDISAAALQRNPNARNGQGNADAEAISQLNGMGPAGFQDGASYFVYTSDGQPVIYDDNNVLLPGADDHAIRFWRNRKDDKIPFGLWQFQLADPRPYKNEMQISPAFTMMTFYNGAPTCWSVEPDSGDKMGFKTCKKSDKQKLRFEQVGPDMYYIWTTGTKFIFFNKKRCLTIKDKKIEVASKGSQCAAFRITPGNMPPFPVGPVNPMRPIPANPATPIGTVNPDIPPPPGFIGQPPPPPGFIGQPPPPPGFIDQPPPPLGLNDPAMGYPPPPAFVQGFGTQGMGAKGSKQGIYGQEASGAYLNNIANTQGAYRGLSNSMQSSKYSKYTSQTTQGATDFPSPAGEFAMVDNNVGSSGFLTGTNGFGSTGSVRSINQGGVYGSSTQQPGNAYNNMEDTSGFNSKTVVKSRNTMSSSNRGISAYDSGYASGSPSEFGSVRNAASRDYAESYVAAPSSGTQQPMGAYSGHRRRRKCYIRSRQSGMGPYAGTYLPLNMNEMGSIRNKNIPPPGTGTAQPMPLKK